MVGTCLSDVAGGPLPHHTGAVLSARVAGAAGWHGLLFRPAFEGAWPAPDCPSSLSAFLPYLSRRRALEKDLWQSRGAGYQVHQRLSDLGACFLPPPLPPLQVVIEQWLLGEDVDKDKLKKMTGTSKCEYGCQYTRQVKTQCVHSDNQFKIQHTQWRIEKNGAGGGHVDAWKKLTK